MRNRIAVIITIVSALIPSGLYAQQKAPGGASSLPEDAFADQPKLNPGYSDGSILRKAHYLPLTDLTDVHVAPVVPSAFLPEEPQPSLATNKYTVAPIQDNIYPVIPAGNGDGGASPNSRNVTFNGLDLVAGYEGLHDKFARPSSLEVLDERVDLLGEEPVRPHERYHWSGLLGESLFFNVVENSFRIASDDQIRDLLAHKPFWRDWVESTRQFNMRRWNDGDDFLVNYVGHPMQGAVSGFIEIQNDPIGRQQEIGATRAYWMSRFRALLWATVYSTHSEISPIGEAGIGNEGGWTYPLNCSVRCTAPGSYKKYTNNTGWVDFIITPAVGSLWILTEDALDRYVSDRIQRNNQSRAFPKILRGALNPSRTMANAMRLKKPWYRDFQYNSQRESSDKIHFLPPDEKIEAARLRRFRLAPYFVALPIGTGAQHCSGCFENPGGGLEADFLFTRWVGLSFAMGRQQGTLEKTPVFDSSIADWSMGARFIHQGLRNAISLAVRPGLLYDNYSVRPLIDPFRIVYASQPVRVNTTHATTTAMVSNDFSVNRYISLRSSFGATVTRYRSPIETPPGIGKPPYLSWMSHDNYTERAVWTTQFGPVLNF
jgi:hypothetical protein